MTIQRLQTDARMSGAVIHNGMIWLSGEIANDRTAGVYQQTKETLESIERLLEFAGTDKEHILSATIYLRDIERDFDLMNEAWDQWIPLGHAPARATVAAKMCFADILVEISIVAAVPD